MDILDRFSTHLKEILAKAMQIASELKHREIEPLHLLFALINEKGSVAAEIISHAKPDVKILEQMIFAVPTEPGAEKILLDKSIASAQIPPLSALSKIALEKALIVAQKNGHNYLGSEHLLAALLDLDDIKLKEFFKVSNLKIEAITKEIDSILANASQFPGLDDVAEAAEHIQENLLGPSTAQPVRKPRKSKRKNEKNSDSALEYFAVNLTDPDNQKNIDPLVGREQEVERLIQILSRRTKNNPILLGDPGVGKTAIVEGLAKKIIEGAVPDKLRRKKIYSVDLGLLVAGTIYRGEFESRLKDLIDEAVADSEIILFIDEIHNIVGAGSSQGSMDAANLLKPALARGQIHCIGSTTPAEYKKFFESDAALERRFMPIIVREPNIAEAEKILRGIKKNFESFHQVKIEDKAADAAVTLSARYVSGKFLPDKAIDLIDETAAAKRLSVRNSPDEETLFALRDELKKVRANKETAAFDDRFDEALKLKEREAQLAVEIEKMEKTVSKKGIAILGVVTAHDVLAQVAKMTGVEPSELTSNSGQKFIKLSKELGQRIIGQDETIDQVVGLIRRAELGLSSPDKPIASFLFVGSSGVGKTELGKSLSEALYPGQDALIRLDMSEFSESYGASKLLGSPAGYIGYKEANQFTDRLKLQPYSVVLFDEIDKAHPDILKLLLQILEEGRITDSTGKKISLKHAIIILTTSYGADELKKGAFGFTPGNLMAKESRTKIREKLKERFSPELINRLDCVCVFNELSINDLAKIAFLEIDSLNRQLKKYQTKISADGVTMHELIKGLEEKNINARDIRQKIRAEVEKIMADIILKSKPKKSYALIAEFGSTINLK
ncbi:MAG: ATP-dependent Clp protease ATP-binding subunit [Candidatus Magasanikbacteria bacterium]|nr:ATP-dependent Clp protease ATP-binding subunit [Candidatus Magasanikbacteria bacterium]